MRGEEGIILDKYAYYEFDIRILFPLRTKDSDRKFALRRVRAFLENSLDQPRREGIDEKI